MFVDIVNDNIGAWIGPECHTNPVIHKVNYIHILYLIYSFCFKRSVIIARRILVFFLNCSLAVLTQILTKILVLLGVCRRRTGILEGLILSRVLMGI